MIVLHCLLQWPLFSLGYCLSLDLDLSWKSFTLTDLATCTLEVVPLLSSVFILSSSLLLTGSLSSIQVYLQAHIFLVKFRHSCDLNFQLCWWFHMSTSNPYTPVSCFARLQTQPMLDRTVIPLACIHPHLHWYCFCTSPFSQSPSQKSTDCPDSFLSLYPYQFKH